MSRHAGFSSSQSDERLTIEEYDANNDIWTNVTLAYRDYIIESDDAFIDGIEGKLPSDPWLAILFNAEKSRFFNMDINDENSTYNLRIETDGKDNVIRVNEFNNNHSVELLNLLDFINTIHDRLTGKGLSGVWPTDISVQVLTSNPEQYEVSVLFQRGNDMLDVEEDIEFVLIVSDRYHNDSYQPNWIFNSSLVFPGNISLANSGDQIVYEFEHFVLGTEINYDHMAFMVLLEDGTYLKIQFQEPYLTFTGILDPQVYQDVLSYSSDFLASNPLIGGFLPVAWFFSLASVFLLAIVRREIN